MSTVASRRFRSSPEREAGSTWTAIVDLLTQGRGGDARAELLAVEGIAASVIAERTVENVPIVVTCSGPRTRIYCLYDEDAVDGANANEDPLGFNPLNGDWRVSLPCAEDDLAWVQRALNKHGSRITARGLDEAISAGDREQPDGARELTVDPKGFLGS
jgi:hypothetical protein